MNDDLAPCPICGAQPLCQSKQGDYLVLCDNNHPEVAVESFHSMEIAKQFWNEDAAARNQKGFAA